MIELVVEGSLICHSAGDDEGVMIGQQCSHPRFVPGSVRPLPAVVVRVDGQTPTVT